MNWFSSPRRKGIGHETSWPWIDALCVQRSTLLRRQAVCWGDPPCPRCISIHTPRTGQAPVSSQEMTAAKLLLSPTEEHEERRGFLSPLSCKCTCASFDLRHLPVYYVLRGQSWLTTLKSQVKREAFLQIQEQFPFDWYTIRLAGPEAFWSRVKLHRI